LSLPRREQARLFVANFVGLSGRGEMIMTQHNMVLGLFRDHAAAQRCVEALYARGHTTNDINVLMSEQTRSRHFQTTEEHHDTHHEESMGLEGMGVGGAIGTAVGASLAAIAAIGTSLIIPGLNLVLAGPVVAALAGGGAGAITGGLIGGLAGLGMTQENAEVYHRALREGGTVIGVTLHDEANLSDEAEHIKQIMQSFGGEQIHSCC